MMHASDVLMKTDEEDMFLNYENVLEYCLITVDRL